MSRTTDSISEEDYNSIVLNKQEIYETILDLTYSGGIRWCNSRNDNNENIGLFNKGDLI